MDLDGLGGPLRETGEFPLFTTEYRHYAFHMSDIVKEVLIQLKDIFTPSGAYNGDDSTPSKEGLLAMLELLRSILDK